MRLYLAEYLLYGIHEVRTHDTFRLSSQCAHTGAEGGGGTGMMLIYIIRYKEKSIRTKQENFVMRKKWTYVAIVSMMLGVAPVFTGCVDTDEPAGLSELRGAKAELLRAKAAVETANAELISAQAAVEAAKVAIVQAKARQQELLADRIELANELKELQNEEKRAAVEKRLAEIEMELAEAEVQHQITMQNLQYNLAVAQRNYEVLMQQIAIAEAVGEGDYTLTLATLRERVEKAYNDLYVNEMYELQAMKYTLEEYVWRTNEILYNAIQNKKNGYDTDKDGVKMEDEEDPTYWAESLLVELEQAKRTADAEATALEKLQEFQKMPVEDTDWRAQLSEVEADIDDLQKQIDEQDLALDEAYASQEYIDAWQKVYGVFDKKPADVELGTNGRPTTDPVQDGAIQVMDDAEAALLKAQKEKPLTIPAYEGPQTEITDEMWKAMGYDMTDPDVQLPTYTQGKLEFKWNSTNKVTSATDYPADVKTAMTNYQNWIKQVGAATIDENEVAQAEATLKRTQEEADDLEDAYVTARDAWTTVQGIISAGEDYTIPATEYAKTFTKDVTDYNTAYAKLETAIDNWNEAIQNEYDEAYDEAYAAAIAGKITNVVDGTATEVSLVYGTFDATDLTKVQGLWDNTAPAQQTESTLRGYITQYCAATADETVAEQVDVIMGRVSAYLTQETNSIDWQENTEPSLVATAKQAVDDFAEKDNNKAANQSLQKMMTAAVINVSKAYGKFGTLEEGQTGTLKTFANLAATYAQAVDADALNAATMVGVKGTDGKFAVNTDWRVQSEKALGGTTYTYTIANTSIEEAEITAATTTTFDENLIESALDAKSIAAFGIPGRYVEPSREVVEKYYAENPTTAPSAASKWYAKLNEVEALEAQISASDDLQALEEELTTAYANFQKAVSDAYTAAFGTLEADYDAKALAYSKAKKALDDVKAKYNETNVAIADLKAQKAALEEVKGTLQKLAWDYLGIDWPADDDENGYDGPADDENATYDPDTFEDQLQAAIDYQETVVASANQAVQEAQTAYDECTAGDDVNTYDGVDYWQFKVDAAQREWDKQYEKYTKAAQDVEKALEVLAGDTEQPAE